MVRSSLILSALILFLFLPQNARGQVCDGEGGCVTLTQMGEGLYAEFEHADQSKVAPGYGAVRVVEFEPDQMPILLDAFNGGGFDCSGGVSPSTGTGATGGSAQTTNMTCGFQNSNGDYWRVSITITWRYNAANGRWEVADIDVQAKLIKAQFQNQVR